MSDDLVKQARLAQRDDRMSTGALYGDLADRIEELEAQLAEMTRRRDAWKDKAEGYDAVRQALREKVGTPRPPHMSRLLWAGIAADEKKRADDAEAQLAAMTAERDVNLKAWKNACVREDKNHDRAEAAEAAIPRAYAMGVEAAAKRLNKYAAERGSTKTSMGRTANHYARGVRAMTPPADLVERVLKGGE